MFAAIIALSGAAILSYFFPEESIEVTYADKKITLQYILINITFIVLIIGISVWFTLPKQTIDSKNEETDFSFKKALALLNQDTIEMQEVSKRWKADMQSDSWLSKNTRPMTLIFLTVAMVLLIFIDSTGLDFTVDGGWVDLLKSLLITVYVAYFGSRGAEKFKTISK